MSGQDNAQQGASAACFRCGSPVEIGAGIGRRDTCHGCGQELHCCLACRFYDPGLHNACREPQAEWQLDKGRANFCDYFSLRVGPLSAPAGRAAEEARAKLEALFGGRGQ